MKEHFSVSILQDDGVQRNNSFQGSVQTETCIEAAGALIIPILIEKGQDRYGVEQLSAHGPAGSVYAVVWYLDGRETMAGQCLQRGKHRTAHKSLAQLWLIHERIVLK